MENVCQNTLNCTIHKKSGEYAPIPLNKVRSNQGWGQVQYLYLVLVLGTCTWYLYLVLVLKYIFISTCCT